MYQFNGVKEPGILGDCTVIISPPRLRLKLRIFDTCIYYIIDPHCMYGGCTHLDSLLSWIHNVFLMAMTSLMESSMDLRCIVGSYA